MVSSGNVRSDLSSINSCLSNYSSTVNNLSSSWKGFSFDSLSSQSEGFVSEYKSVLEGEMNAFASACDLYVEYKKTKNYLNNSQRNYDEAVKYNQTADISRFQTEIDKYKSTLENLKGQIESNLERASATVLTATSISGSTGVGVSSLGSNNKDYVTGTLVLNGNEIDISSPVEYGTKYDLSEDDLAYLGYVAMREQGDVEGAKVELSLMVNLYEKNKSNYSSVADYVQNSGWFASYSTQGYSYPGDSYVDAAREVVADGVHYLPSNVVEHDCLSDIESISTGSVGNRNDYIPGETIIQNSYGARYVFVGFAPNGGDPFGYLV